MSLKEEVIQRKLCLVIPSMQAGGMERVMSQLAWYFAERKELELHLVLYGMTREIFYELPENLQVHKPSFQFNKRRRFISTLRTLGFLRRCIKSIRPESILSFGELWNSFVLLALYGLSIPVYISDRCSPERSYNKLHRMLRSWLYPRATGIIAQTGKAKEIYSGIFGHRNIQVIGNPIRQVKDTAAIQKENEVLMVGRLIRSKHQDELIKLFLKIQVPGWKLVLVGYDHLKQNNQERLQAIIDEEDAWERVSLEGKQSGVDDYYLRSRIFAFTSSSEGFPNVIGEAMSAGLPVVAFDCVAGPSDMISEGESGYLVPLYDYKLFRERLESLMRDGALREAMGERGREKILEFSIEHIGELFLHFILDKNIKTN